VGLCDRFFLYIYAQWVFFSGDVPQSVLATAQWLFCLVADNLTLPPWPCWPLVWGIDLGGDRIGNWVERCARKTNP